MASAAAWAGLAGLANFIGGRMQDSYEDERRQKLAAMQEEAQMKRQMFLEEYRNKIQQQSREADHERTKGDVTASFTNPETGSIYGRTRSGETIPLMETSQQYRDDLAAQRKANNEFKDRQVELYRQRTLDAENRIKHRDNPPPRATLPSRSEASSPKEPKPAKPSSMRLNNNEWMKYHEADALGPSYPANPNGERPSGEDMPDRSGGVSPVFVDPSVNSPRAAGSSTGSTNKPSPEQIMSDANAKAQQIAKIADPQQRQAAQAKLDVAVKAMFQKYGYAQ